MDTPRVKYTWDRDTARPCRLVVGPSDGEWTVEQQSADAMGEPRWEQLLSGVARADAPPGRTTSVSEVALYHLLYR